MRIKQLELKLSVQLKLVVFCRLVLIDLWHGRLCVQHAAVNVCAQIVLTAEVWWFKTLNQSPLENQMSNLFYDWLMLSETWKLCSSMWFSRLMFVNDAWLMQGNKTCTGLQSMNLFPLCRMHSFASPPIFLSPCPSLLL